MTTTTAAPWLPDWAAQGVQEAAATHYASVEEVQGPGRSERIARARAAVIRFLHGAEVWSLAEIAAFVGRDKATVLYQIRKMNLRNPESVS